MGRLEHRFQEFNKHIEAKLWGLNCLDIARELQSAAEDDAKRGNLAVAEDNRDGWMRLLRIPRYPGAYLRHWVFLLDGQVYDPVHPSPVPIREYPLSTFGQSVPLRIVHSAHPQHVEADLSRDRLRYGSSLPCSHKKNSSSLGRSSCMGTSTDVSCSLAGPTSVPHSGVYAMHII